MKNSSPVALTARDLDILRFIAGRTLTPLDAIADELFAFDPLTKKPNKNPRRACERRLHALKRAGYVRIEQHDDGTKKRAVVSLEPRADRTLGKAVSRRRIPVGTRGHHLRTQDIVAIVERMVRLTGGRLLEVRYEPELRRELMKGRFGQGGAFAESLPDAACLIESVRGGKRVTKKLAIEYVTSKYASADIASKVAGFRGYDQVVWVADRSATADRVRRITGQDCTVVS